MNSLLKHPSAWIPIAVPLIIVAIWIVSISMFGPPVRQPDEETAAHLFQIWFVLEVLAVAFFSIKWLSRRPRQALSILALQIIASLAACAPVFYFYL